MAARVLAKLTGVGRSLAACQSSLLRSTAAPIQSSGALRTQRSPQPPGGEARGEELPTLPSRRRSPAPTPTSCTTLVACVPVLHRRLRFHRYGLWV